MLSLAGLALAFTYIIQDTAMETASLLASPGLTLRFLYLPLQMQKYSFQRHEAAEGQ